MPLKEYKRKRKFDSTPEPPGKIAKSGHVYCIQKHDASHLHYDFRLQVGGVLKSWAVPKGPSLDPKQKRLAVEVEDHPVDYAQFEGIIPEGYGAGEVIVWDFGTWEPIGDIQKGLKKGHLDFILHGQKLQGRWMIVRTHRPSSKPQWLLMKKQDDAARPSADYDVVEQEKESVLSRVHLSRDKSEKAPATQKAKKKKVPTPSFVEPQLARLAKTPPHGSEWIHEIKFDGYRTLGRIDGGKVKLLTRTGLDWTTKYKNIEAELSKLKVQSAMLDGEIVRLDENGRSDFGLLQEGLKKKSTDLIYYVFDLLFLDGEDYRDRPLRERKEALKAVIAKSQLRRVLFSDDFNQAGSAVLTESCKAGLEGIISKEKEAPYASGRGNSWIKTKCIKGQEFVIIGYTQPGGSRVGFGALLLGTYEKGELTYAGRVGTGFDQKKIRELMKKAAPLKQEKSPITKKIPDSRDAVWLKPELVCEVQFAEITKDGVLRHASFKALRADKPAAQVSKDEPIETKVVDKASKKKSSGVVITHPDKVLIPATHVTKGDIAEYYTAIQKWILPHIVDRPLSLLRCPDGIEKICFFQKNLSDSSQPDVHQDSVDGPKGKKEHLIYIQNVSGLMGLTQMGVLELHVWGTHRQHFNNPDHIVFDLDPGPGIKWKQIAQGAMELRDLLMQLKLKSFVKTSGGKGLHVCVPVSPVHSWEEIKAFTKAVAQFMNQQNPKLYLAKMSKNLREKKIFIDYLRNGYGATAVSIYSTRARDQAGVSFPIEWKDVEDIGPADFTIKNVAEILSKRKKDPWADYLKIRQQIRLGGSGGGLSL